MHRRPLSPDNACELARARFLAAARPPDGRGGGRISYAIRLDADDGLGPAGVMRRHMKREDGTFRDSVIYSVLAGEWPGVKAGLERRLG